MAYTDAIFYPAATVVDQTIGAGTVKVIRNAVPAVNATSTTTWAGATITDITVIPLANNSTVTTDTTANNGWAFDNAGATGLGSISTARRVILTGVWAFQGTVNLNKPATLQTVSATIKAVVYRVATGGGARTELFRTAASAAVTNASAIAAADVNWSVSSASQSQFTLAAGEVIMVGYIITSRNTVDALAAVTNTVVIFYLGNQVQANQFTVPSSGIRTLFSTTLAAIAANVASLVRQIGKLIPLITATVTPVFTRRITAFKTFANTATVTAVMTRVISAARSFANTATGTAAVTKRVGKPLSAIVTVTATRILSVLKPLSYIVTVTPTIRKAITKGVFVVTATVTAGFARAVTAARLFLATATVSTRMFVQIADTILNRMVSGGTTVVKKVIYLFDD